MLNEEQIREEIRRLEKLQTKYHTQLLAAVKASSTISIQGICDSMNIAEAWIDALEYVLEERKKGIGLTFAEMY